MADIAGRDPLNTAFVWQRHTSKVRGIPFLLTFEEWLSIWQASGHLEKRGKRRGQYCMARFGDVGPYAVGNVEIIKCEENTRRQVISPEGKERARQANLGQRRHRKLTDSQVRQIRKDYHRPSYRVSNTHQLAERYGVCTTTIEKIINGKTYGGV